MNIVGLGHCGCAIAKKFSQYPQYSTFYIDTEKWSDDGQSYVFEKHVSHEEYEDKCPNLKKFFGKCKGDVLFIVGGSGTISGASLRILEQLKECRISVLYVQPNLDFLSGKAKLQERAVFQVFQEFARSGVFQRLYLVNNVSVEMSLSNVTVTGYFEMLNEAIASTLHMVNVWLHSEPAMTTLEETDITDRISTFGVMNIDTGEERMLFPLANVTDKNILYAINEDALKSEGSLLSKIREQVKRKMVKDMKVSFAIYPTDYVGSQVYVLSHTKILQQQGS